MAEDGCGVCKRYHDASNKYVYINNADRCSAKIGRSIFLKVGAHMRIGILGCGRIGQVHALSVDRIPEAKLIAVADAHSPAEGVLAWKLGMRPAS